MRVNINITVIAIIIYGVSFLLYTYIKKINIKNNKHILVNNLIILYLISLFCLTILNINPSNTIKHLNYIPFKNLFDNINIVLLGANKSSATILIKLYFLNAILNILLFTPIGFLFPQKWPKFYSYKKIILIGAIISTFIEIIQFTLLTGRSGDIDDVIFNVIGSIIGYCILTIYKHISNKKGA